MSAKVLVAEFSPELQRREQGEQEAHRRVSVDEQGMAIEGDQLHIGIVPAGQRRDTVVLHR